MLWAHLDLTVAKKPLLYDNERIIFTVSNVVIYNNEEKVPYYKQGYAYLTNQRLCYVDEKLPDEYSVYTWLSQIVSIEYVPKFFKASAKICISLTGAPTASFAAATYNPWICPICFYSNTIPKNFVFGASDLPSCTNCGVKSTSDILRGSIVGKDKPASADSSLSKSFVECPRCTFHNHPSLRSCEVCGTALSLYQAQIDLSPKVKFSFRNGGSKNFFAYLRSLTFKETDESSVATSAVEPQVLSYRSGIHGLEQASASRQSASKQALEEAFGDVGMLNTKAKEIMQLVELYKRTHSDPLQGLSLDGDLVLEDTSKDENTFHEQLARQIVEFLDKHEILNREGGVISIYDVFSIYNRARGSDLVSPEGLNSAIEVAETIGLPIRVRKLRGGLRVVETKLWKSSQQRISEWIAGLEEWQRTVGVSALDTSAKFGWSLLISVEELELAEEDGLLCRDEQPSGVRFFQNLLVSGMDDM